MASIDFGRPKKETFHTWNYSAMREAQIATWQTLRRVSQQVPPSHRPELIRRTLTMLVLDLPESIGYEPAVFALCALLESQDILYLRKIEDALILSALQSPK